MKLTIIYRLKKKLTKINQIAGIYFIESDMPGQGKKPSIAKPIYIGWHTKKEEAAAKSAAYGARDLTTYVLMVQ